MHAKRYDSTQTANLDDKYVREFDLLIKEQREFLRSLKEIKENDKSNTEI